MNIEWNIRWCREIRTGKLSLVDIGAVVLNMCPIIYVVIGTDILDFLQPVICIPSPGVIRCVRCVASESGTNVEETAVGDG